MHRCIYKCNRFVVRGHEVLLHPYVEVVCHGAFVCGGCSKGGRVVEICSAGRVCGDAIQYVYTASGRGEVHHYFCERKMTRRVRGSE